MQPTDHRQPPPSIEQPNGFGGAADKIVLAIWANIGLCLAVAAYLVVYDQLPDSIKIWLDPRVFAVAVIFFVIGIGYALREFWQMVSHANRES
ncbi:MAG: hypothetical protein HYU78_11425 [Rhodocyclales bacterium]|nr:hypothetical protein [Rhodocyclales bacterium]